MPPVPALSASPLLFLRLGFRLHFPDLLAHMIKVGLADPDLPFVGDESRLLLHR